MNLQWFTSPEWANIVKALLHTLWQGAVVAVVLGLALRRMDNPVTRYRSSLAAMAGIVLAGLVTWGVLNRPVTQPVATTPAQALQPVTAAAPAADVSTPQVVYFPPPGSQTVELGWTAWLALVWLAGATVMIGRAGFQVAGAERLRRASQPVADARIAELLAEARLAVGLVRRVRLAVTDRLTSPAVVGVLVPTLILPLSLMSTLTPEQIRFILLHELAHIQRGDYFANLFQLFAEALLFFNPAVWWISLQMRLEREACCDALAIELSGAPADYARTLVHVAENVLATVPQAAPAFGDKREPSSLADRVQRMLVPGYRPRLRLTWRAMLAASFMGGALLTLSAIGTRVTVAAILSPEQRIEHIEKNTNEPAILITAHLYQARAATFETVASSLKFNQGAGGRADWWLVPANAFSQVHDELNAHAYQKRRALQLLTSDGRTGGISAGSQTNSVHLTCMSVITNGQITVSMQWQMVTPWGQTTITNRLDARAMAEDHGGLLMHIANPEDKSGSNFVVFVGMEIVTNPTAGRFQQRLQTIISRPTEAVVSANVAPGEGREKLPPPDAAWVHNSQTVTFKLDGTVRESMVKQALVDAGVLPPTVCLYNEAGILLVRGTVDQLGLADRVALKLNGYSQDVIEADSRGFVKKLSEQKATDTGSTNLLFTRTFKVETRVFVSNLKKMVGDMNETTNSSPEISAAARKCFTKLGVDLESPPGKAIFFNDKSGMLFVKATEADLEVVDRAIQVINSMAPQIHIKARFVEVPKGTFQMPSNGAVGPFTAILDNANGRALLGSLQSSNGFEVLGEPEVTTLSGRQCQMRTTQLMTVITNCAYQESTNNGSGAVRFQTFTYETGPILDVTPYVLADGYTIYLPVTPSLHEFLGYDSTTNTKAAYTRTGERIDLPVMSPKFREQKIPVSANVWDDQTLLIGGMTVTNTIKTQVPVIGSVPLLGRLFRNQQAVPADVFVFVTATIVDPAGNRAYPEGGLPAGRNQIPPQPAVKQKSP